MKEIKYKDKLEEEIEEDKNFKKKEFTNLDEEIFEEETKQDKEFEKEDPYKFRRRIK